MFGRIVFLAAFAAVFAAGAADMITAREATEIAEGVVAAVPSDDAGQTLPKYLGAFAFEDTYAEDAAWYYDQLDSFGGACSARRIGSTLERNYDWFYDESATFVVSVSASDSRFASIGVASVGTRITADDLKARTWSRYWRCLPGTTLDGVNSCGVAAEINVVITNGSPWETRGGRDINAVGAVRWVLDHAASARDAAAELAARVYIPESMKRRGYSAHFAVCDASESWVVEDGIAERRPSGVPAVMTNFRVLDPTEPYGTGYERYATLTNEANSITSAWFRAAYRRPFSRPTEFAAPGVGAWTETDSLLAWAEANVPAGAPETLERGRGSWQTVHCSVYDMERRTLRIAVQETDDWYSFSLPTAAVTPVPRSMAGRVGYMRPRTSGGKTRLEDENGAVVIGKGAVGTVDPDYIRSLEGGDTNVYIRSSSVAIGHNATARDANGRQAQSIAIGWNSKASAVNAIAIGSGAVHWYEDDTTGPAAVASSDQAVAVGYDAKARASGAVQLGRGVNESPNSLKFQNVYVVKDGKVQGGGTNTNDVRAISREETKDALDPSVVSELGEEIVVKSHAMTTYSPTNGTPEEVGVIPSGTRNYEIYLPNTPEMRAGLPFSFDTDIEGEVAKLGPWWTNRIVRLPAKITMKEPLPKTLILEVDEYATGWDWTPVVVRAFETNGAVRIEGTNLHFAAAARIGGAEIAVRNPLYGVVNVATNGVSGVAGALVGKGGDEIASFVVEQASALRVEGLVSDGSGHDIEVLQER